MKVKNSLFLTWLSIALPMLFSLQANAQKDVDYCYKPSEPLFLSTTKTKTRYAEDMLEYQRCKLYFVEMKQRVELLKNEHHERTTQHTYK